jgi:hypothetical protein
VSYTQQLLVYLLQIIGNIERQPQPSQAAYLPVWAFVLIPVLFGVIGGGIIAVIFIEGGNRR